jgi:hypothetical protein
MLLAVFLLSIKMELDRWLDDELEPFEILMNIYYTFKNYSIWPTVLVIPAVLVLANGALRTRGGRTLNGLLDSRCRSAQQGF